MRHEESGSAFAEIRATFPRHTIELAPSHLTWCRLVRLLDAAGPMMVVVVSGSLVNVPRPLNRDEQRAVELEAATYKFRSVHYLYLYYGPNGYEHQWSLDGPLNETPSSQT